MKKRFFLLFLVLALLTACTSAKPAESELFAMDTLMQIRIWGDDALLSEVSGEIRRIEGLFSVTSSDSEIAVLNRDGTAQVSDETLMLIQTAIDISKRTGGAFDPTVYPLVRAWGFTTDERHVLTQAELDSLLPLVGTEHVSTDGGSVSLSSGTMLDLGGIVKGYAAQRCAELLSERGAEAALLSLGGNVQTVGTKPDGSDWVVGIADPNAPAEAAAILTFHGTMALVTSGGYQRYFTENGKSYHHILDPETGYPADNGLASVTVLADNGTLADALSTALFVMGLEDAAEFWRGSEDFEAVFLLESGEIYATQGAAELLSGCEFQTIEK